MISALFLIDLPGSGDILDPIGLMSSKYGQFATLGSALSALLPYLFIIGGIILLGMLIAGGLGLMTAQGNEEKVQQGAAKIKNSLVGYLLLFASYWLAQIVQVVFKIPIL